MDHTKPTTLVVERGDRLNSSFSRRLNSDLINFRTTLNKLIIRDIPSYKVQFFLI